MTGIEPLTQAIDDLLAEGAEGHCDATSLKELVCQHSRLESVVSSAVGAYDTSGDWAIDGARTAQAWLARSCRLPKATARRLVRRGRQLRHLPVVAQAFEDGAINAAHVDAVAAVRRDGTEAALERDEPLLVKQAKRLRFEHFAKAVAYWDQLADPDGTEEAAEARRARRDVYLEASISGMYLGSMTLDPISGSIVAGELGRIEDEFFKADWARARAELGHNPSVDQLWRSPAQRRADALVEMAGRSSLVEPEGVARPPAPLFSVLVDWPTLSGRVCELAEGIVVSPGELVPWLCVADLERAVMEPSGQRRGLDQAPALQRGDAPGPRAPRPRLRPPLLRRPGLTLPGRPHLALGAERADHPGQRAPALWVPQPPAQRAPAAPDASSGGAQLTGREAQRRVAKRGEITRDHGKRAGVSLWRACSLLWPSVCMWASGPDKAHGYGEGVRWRWRIIVSGAMAASFSGGISLVAGLSGTELQAKASVAATASTSTASELATVAPGEDHDCIVGPPPRSIDWAALHNPVLSYRLRGGQRSSPAVVRRELAHALQ